MQKIGLGLLLYFLVIFNSLIGQSISYEQFTDSDGLPSMTIYNIVQDSLGLIWMGTENGLVSFDGDEFVRFSHPELKDNDMVDIAINNHGRIYFLNLSGQLGFLENNKVTLLNDERILNKAEKIGAINNKDYVVTYKNGIRLIYEIKISPDNSFDFIPTDICYFDIEDGTYYTILSPYSFQCNKDSSIVSREQGEKQFESEHSTFYLDQPSVAFQLFKVDPLVDQYIRKNGYEKLLKYNNDFFIIDSKGAIFFDSRTRTFQSFLEDIRVNTIFIDSENNAWASTPNNGLYRISNIKAKLKQAKMNISDGISDIVKDENGNIYLGTLTGGVVINPMRDKKFFNASQNFRPIKFVDNNNEMIAYELFSISRIDKATLSFEKITNELYRHKKILIDGSTFLVGTSRGLLKRTYEDYVIHQNRRKRNYLINLRISELHKQKNSNTIYMGTINGLYEITEDSIRNTQNESLQSMNISSITDGEDKAIWVGTRSQGVFEVRNDSILSDFNIANGLKSNNISNIEKHQNELLVSTNSGMHIIDLSTGRIKIISEYNFLPSDDVLVSKVIDNKYWIGTMKGLTIISKEDINESNVNKSFLSLKKLYVNGTETTYESGMQFDHHVNNIQLNIQNISYKSGKDKYIKYRISKIDTTWITTIEPIIRLPSLKTGGYDIEALGVNAIGVESIPLRLSFFINPPWWNTLWAKILGALLILAIGYIIIQYRGKRIRAEEELKRDYLGQINKIKDQALQLQMNPHFIFNSLNAIQGFIGTDDEEKAMNYLARFARLIRLIFEHSKGNTITLEEELEFLNLYLNLEKLRFKNKVNVDINIDSEINVAKDIINVPPLLIQPIVENSFKHGLFHKKGKGNLKIDFSIKDEVIEIVIEDDGIGREASQKIIRKNREKNISSGIKTTMERIDLLNFGQEKKLNSVHIEDLYDKEGRASGTKTILNLAV